MDRIEEIRSRIREHELIRVYVKANESDAQSCIDREFLLSELDRLTAENAELRKALVSAHGVELFNRSANAELKNQRDTAITALAAKDTELKQKDAEIEAYHEYLDDRLAEFKEEQDAELAKLRKVAEDVLEGAE